MSYLRWKTTNGTIYGDLTLNPLPVTVSSISGAGGMTDDTAFTPATSSASIMGAFADMTAPDSVDEGDGGALRMTLNRNLLVQIRDAAGNERGLNVDASGQIAVVLGAGTAAAGSVTDGGIASTTVRGNISSADLTTAADLTAAPTSGQKIVVDDLFVSADTTMRVDFIEETSGTVVLSVYVAANGLAQLTPRAKLKLPVADKKLRAQASVAGNLRICALTHSEA